MKILLNILVFLLWLIVRSQQQYVGLDTDPEEEGKVTVHVIDIELDKFLESIEEFRSIVAVYASQHCKKSSSHCDAEDKHIRAKDVIITENTAWGDNDDTQYVKVKLYVRDHLDPTMPALTANQLASVFYNYEDEIEDDYGHRVDVHDPARSDLEDWQIAVIVILSVLVAGLIVFAIVFGYKQYSQKRERLENIEDEDISRSPSCKSGTLDDSTPGYEALGEEAPSPIYTEIETATNEVIHETGADNILDTNSGNTGFNEVTSANSDTANILVDESDINTAM